MQANAVSRNRKYPQFQQNEIFGLSDAFRKLDVDDKGYIDEATAIKATQQSERQPYDVVRQALKNVELDSSRRVELEDYVGVSRPVSDSLAPLHPRPDTILSAANRQLARRRGFWWRRRKAALERTTPLVSGRCGQPEDRWTCFQRKRQRQDPRPGVEC